MTGYRTARRVGLWSCLAIPVSSLALSLFAFPTLLGSNHVSGVWIGLAYYVDAGVLYPPLENDGFYAGSRYMPVFFVMHGLAARLFGDFILAGKLIIVLSTALLGWAIYLASRRACFDRLASLASASLIYALQAGLAACLIIRGDALPAALSVLGLVVVSGTTKRRGDFVAVMLFATAFFIKFNTVAGIAAAVLYVGIQDRRRAIRLATTYVGVVAAALVIVMIASDGRFLVGMRSLASGGMGSGHLGLGPARMLFAISDSLGLKLLLPFAMFSFMYCVLERKAGVWDLYFLLVGATTLITFTSPGTERNHLLELEAASLVLLSRHLAPEPPSSWGGFGFIAAHLENRRNCRLVLGDAPPTFLNWSAICVVGVLVFEGACLHIDAWKVVLGDPPLTSAQVRDELAGAKEILSEDATIPVVIGRRPVLLDPFAFRLLAEKGWIDPEPLALRIENKEFDALVLLVRIDREEESLSPAFHFGPEVTDAIRANYHFDRKLGTYSIFVPND